jgi:dTDP-4-dehydrorhamnose 3,5-epimerase-like enzyme
MTASLSQLVDIPQRGDHRGQLSVAELGGALPFPVRRVYWIHGTKPGVSRGFHAHRELRQLCVCVAGSVRIALFDGRREESVNLDSSAKGLLIGPGLWREMHDFSPDCVLMVFADAEYDEADYIRDRGQFTRHAAAQSG